MSKEVKVIDVRTPGEFAGGHVEGSINIPLDTIQARIDEIRAIKESIILCCASGGRSYSAYMFLNANGCTNVKDGGAWHQVAQTLKN